MKKNRWLNLIMILLISIVFLNNFYAQGSILNSKSPNEVYKDLENFNKDSVKHKDRPLPYPNISDRDILWSKVTWEIIDLNEKFNFPYYFPIDTSFIEKDRRSLFDVLMIGIKTGEITEVYSNGYWTAKLSMNEIMGFLQRIDTTELGIDQLNSGQPVSPEYIQKTTITSRDISQIRIKGMWFLDKRHSELKYRPIGIGIVSPDVNEKFSEDPDMVELFWVWYSDARDVLSRAKAYNNDNASSPISFDQMINTRRFNGMIYLEDNMYGNRKIQDYIKENAMLQLQESKRIKEIIREKELNFWIY